MNYKEMWRLFLVAVICNGWWLWAKYPTVGAGDKVQVNPLVIAPGLAMFVLLVWAVVHSFKQWEREGG